LPLERHAFAAREGRAESAHRLTPIETDAGAVAEWRFRNYLDHLSDLGYDIHAGGPTVPISIETSSVDVAVAVEQYVDRSHRRTTS